MMYGIFFSYVINEHEIFSNIARMSLKVFSHVFLARDSYPDKHK